MNVHEIDPRGLRVQIPPHGGPADTATTAAIEERANELLAKG